MDRYQAFRAKMEPYAKRAGASLREPWEVILGQWSWESDEGTSELFLKANNAGGVKWVPKSIASGKYTIGSNVYAKYSSFDQMVDDFIRVINNGYYENVKNATTIEGTLQALGASPYAESPYKDANGKPGFGLVSLMSAMGLRVAGSESFDNNALPNPSVNNMGTDDLKKYATIGVAVVGLLAVSSFFHK